MQKWPLALVVLSLVFGGCSSSTTSGGEAEAAAEGEGSNNPADVPEGADPAKFEEPDLTPGPSPCAGLAHGAIPKAAAEWDTVECLNPVPSNPCTLDGTQSRTYSMCYFAGIGGGESCADGGCSCGELGLECVERTVVDERTCTLGAPTEALSAGPWGPCQPPVGSPCAATGTRTRLELVCQDGQPVEVTSAEQACDTDLEGVVITEGAFAPTCDLLFEQADRTLCPTFDSAEACEARSDLCEWTGAACAHLGNDEPDRCVQSIPQTRSLEVCEGGAVVQTPDSRDCTRSTDGRRFDNADSVTCVPVDIDDCFATGERPGVEVSSCQGGVANIDSETLPCDLEAYTAGPYTLSSLSDLKRYAEIGRPEGGDVHGYGLTIDGAQFIGPVVACRLTRIDGDLDISGVGAQNIELSSLTEVTGDVTLTGGPETEVLLPALRAIGGHLQVSGLSWDNLDLASLQEVGTPDAAATGNVNLSNGAGQLMALPLLAQVRGNLTVSNNGALLRFDLPALSEVGGDFTIRHNDLLQVFEASNLTSIGGVLRLGGAALRVCDAFAYVSVLSSRDALGDPCPGAENQTDVYEGDPVLPACIFFDELDLTQSGTPYRPSRSKLDHDADFVVDACDNCPAATNPNQSDSDHDGVGDECDPS